ncbi:MAG: MerR family transcriptional regulator, partial [Tissierellia bacterium]|nr:MerR family transcriptional regulator [Tissierellia bacterium]
MLIKEIENLSGMERANIRFYEREGLITPKRLDNGYRDYSEDDLQILLRIKLLRSLHISLDEIKELKYGSKNLMDTLSYQIVRLEREKQDISYARDVCQTMKEDRVSFADLDAKKYIDEINQKIKETDSKYFSVEGDELPQVYYPWRRYLARAFDGVIYTIFWSAFLAFVFHVNVVGR